MFEYYDWWFYTLGGRSQWFIASTFIQYRLHWTTKQYQKNKLEKYHTIKPDFSVKFRLNQKRPPVQISPKLGSIQHNQKEKGLASVIQRPRCQRPKKMRKLYLDKNRDDLLNIVDDTTYFLHLNVIVYISDER